MDNRDHEAEYMVLASAALLLLLTPNRLADFNAVGDDDPDSDQEFWPALETTGNCLSDLQSLSRAALYNFRLSNVVTLFEDELGFWVKPRSTTWFSRFLLDQYDDARWIKMFRMNKVVVFSLTELLQPSVYTKNTKYRLVIPVLVKVACTLFKLSSGCSLLICSELFAVGRSTVSMFLRDVVHAINTVLRQEISWPQGDALRETEANFKQLSGLPGVLGAIDGTRMSISKPRVAPADYYHFKSGGYTFNCQAVVNSQKRFLDLFLEMPGSTNNSRMLRRSSLYHKGMRNSLWDGNVSFDGFSPYIVGDAGYPLLPWLLVPHRGLAQLPIADSLFNAKLRRARTVVENAFGLLKQSFRELLVKSDLHVSFLPDVIVACCILHNMLQGQTHTDVERLLLILREEGFDNTAVVDETNSGDALEAAGDDVVHAAGQDIRRQLGGYLAV